MKYLIFFFCQKKQQNKIKIYLPALISISGLEMAWLRLVAWLQAGQGLLSDDAKGFFSFPKGIMVLDVARWWEGNSCRGWELCPPALYPCYMQEVQLVLVGHEPVLDWAWWVLGYNLWSPVFIFAFWQNYSHKCVEAGWTDSYASWLAEGCL